MRYYILVVLVLWLMYCRFFHHGLMGVFGVWRALKIRKLQMKLRPNFQFDESGISKYAEHMFKYTTAPMECYLDLCLADKAVAAIAKNNALSRNDLINISNNVVGGWVKGNHVGLATIAYPETLLYYLEAKKRKVSDLEIAYKLTKYWESWHSTSSLLVEFQSDSERQL